MTTSHQALGKAVQQTLSNAEDLKLARTLIERSTPNIVYSTAAQVVTGETLTASTFLLLTLGTGFNSNAACVGGRAYILDAYLPFGGLGGGGGIKVDLAAGDVQISNAQFTYTQCTSDDPSLVTVTNTNLLNTPVGSDNVDIIVTRISGVFVVTGGGSIGVRFAENTATDSATLLGRAYLSITEIAQ